MSNMSSVVATIQLSIKTKSSNKKLTHPSDPNNIFLRLLSCEPFTPPPEYHMLKSQQTSNLPLHPPLKLPPLPQTSDIHDLKHMIKQVCEQMSTMLNLLTTVLAKMKYWATPFTSPYGTPTD
jgi:hypothetical protein